MAGPAKQSVSVVPNGIGLTLVSVPLILMLTGMVLGFSALRDIRLAHGKLGGAVLATLAAGLLPAIIITAMCGGLLAYGVQQLFPMRIWRSDMWWMGGAVAGVWLSYLMMRGMHRKATGWVPPPGAAEAVRSQLVTAAIVLTIAGAALTFLLMVPAFYLFGDLRSRYVLMVVTLPVLLAGLICGVLSREAKAGRVCAWICGVLFVVLVLTHA